MNYRINTKLISLLVITCVAVAIFYIYTLIAVPKTENVVHENDVATTTPTEERLLSAKHQFVNGVHTIAGKAEVPTSCHRLVTEPFFVGGGVNSVEVRFNTLLEGEECPNEVFEVPFRVSFEAPEDVLISATWNGNQARINLLPLQQGEIIDDELFIKG
jgi:hypothetical protein